MYLKSLKMTGFKSFMRKTELRFEPGMTAIVGPNGCGKSNISDALRWVLGEQSAKALRGHKMEDVIFNGTDTRRPLGMAEVSVTFADCDAVLDTEFNEVTVSRRVLRSGEGQYFLNKRPCRLKDIQRMFMDTGIGTRSYSVLEQGRIDQILSQRPEDRRQIFEEASGITKYKADKAEALRKLDHTEANLLRLADVIREVKRQIGSLQRQAGKARRYKALREELQTLDLHATRQRLKAFDGDLAEVETEGEALRARVQAAHAEIQKLEQDNASLRQAQMNTEREIGTVLEAGVHARSRLDHTRELISMNRQRIDEYRDLSQRDSHEIDDARNQVDTRRSTLETLAGELAELDRLLAASERDLEANQSAYDSHRTTMDTTRAGIQSLREQSVELESQASRLHNRLLELESSERSAVVRRERLTAEKLQLTRASENQARRRHDMTSELNELRDALAREQAAVSASETSLQAAESALANARQHSADLRSAAAARQARIELLDDSENLDSEFPAGARRLLDTANPLHLDPDTVLGSLAAQLDVDEAYRRPLEAVLRAWHDAIVVADPAAARRVLRRLAEQEAGSARLLAAHVPCRTAAPPDVPGDRLLDHVRSDARLQPLLVSLLGTTVVVDSLDDVPDPLPPALRAVTRSGQVMDGAGAAEQWMPEQDALNPLARRYALDQARAEAEALARDLQEAEAELDRCTEAHRRAVSQTVSARAALTGAERRCAQKEGEMQVVSTEADEAARRLETATWELESLLSETASGGDEKQDTGTRLEALRERRDAIAKALQEQTHALRALEDEAGDLQTRFTESRIRVVSQRQKRENLLSQKESVAARVEELETAIRDRSHGLKNYEDTIRRLEEEISKAQASIADLETAVRTHAERVESLRRNQGKQADELKAMEDVLAERRERLERFRDSLSQLDVRRTETRMQRRALLERVTGDYRITADEVMAEPDDTDEAEALPSLDEAETRVAELRLKLEAMGPVNLVAIEEYQELETRFAFLSEQEADLVKSKQQLMDMIRRINRTTSEMFKTTFDEVNRNFAAMFTKLFRGGTAKLVLIDEEDILECGIEIIARPPGKRLQNVSLLSGGERTLTAVALLFGIYMIRPSPFCVLDELDAALDDSNIGRFVTILKGFLEQSQFVVITHNRQTIAAGDVLYGVTMQEKGVSNIVSMKFNEAAAQDAEAAPVAAGETGETPS